MFKNVDMKKLMCFTAILLLFSACTAPLNDKKEKPVRYGWNEYTLYGNVKAVTVKKGSLVDKFGKESIGEIKSMEVYFFDASHGNCTEHLIYSYDGKLFEKNIYVYDSNGNCIEQNSYASDGKLTYNASFDYDSKGRCIAGNFTDSYNNWTLEYYSNAIVLKNYASDGKLIGELVSAYDSNGKFIDQKRYDSAGALIGKNDFVCDSNGNIIEERNYTYKGPIAIPESMTIYEIEYFE